MTLQTRGRAAVLTIAGLLAAILAIGALAGCSAGGTTSSSGEATATPSSRGVSGLAAFPKAIASVRQSVPDSQFLLVQTAQVATSTPPASWSFIFASKKAGKLYMVTVDQGQAAAPVVLGTSTIAPGDYAKIPEPSGWLVDTDKVYQAAVEAYRQRYGTAPPVQYTMGLASFVPKGTNSAIKPFVFKVSFAPATSGGTPRVIEVDAATGKALPAAAK